MKLHLVTAALLVLATVAPVAAGRNNLRRRHLNNLAAFQEDVVDIVSYASCSFRFALLNCILLSTSYRLRCDNFVERKSQLLLLVRVLPEYC